MKKNLLMLLCAVSLLANTVNAETTVADVMAAVNKEEGRTGKANYTFSDTTEVKTPNWFSRNVAKPSSNYLHGSYGMGAAKYIPRKGGFGHFRGAVPHGASHVSRLVNALLLADMLGRDTDSLIGRGIGKAGRRLGFHRKAKDWRRGVYNRMTSRSKLARTLRALSALGLAGLSDAALARMVGDSSAFGAGYRGARRGLGYGWGKARGLWSNPDAVVEEAVAEGADTTPLFGDDEVDMTSFAAGIAAQQATENAGFKQTYSAAAREAAATRRAALSHPAGDDPGGFKARAAEAAAAANAAEIARLQDDLRAAKAEYDAAFDLPKNRTLSPLRGLTKARKGKMDEASAKAANVRAQLKALGVPDAQIS